MGGRTRVGVALSPGALRESRREALVVKLHRYRDSPLEPFGKRPGLTRLVPLVPAEGERKPHHHALRALVLDEPGEGCDLDFVPHQARPVALDYAMSNSFGFGGTNASIVLKRV